MLRNALIAATLAIAGAGSAARADDLPDGPLGELRGPGGSTYTLTSEDALWAVRMLVGEAGGRDDADNAGVLWCMLNSYTLRPVRKSYPTFKDFIRAYCTPLQPYLKSSGAVERHRKRSTPMEEVEPGRFQLKRHLEIQRRPWEALPEGARALVLRVMSGAQPSGVGNATQFCSTRIYFKDEHDRSPSPEEHAAFTEAYAAKKRYTWVKPEGADVMKNCFFEEARFASLPRPAVQVVARKR